MAGGNALYYGDNLDVLRAHIADESIDLIYLDPPFNSQATYNVLFKSPAGTGSQAQIEAFEDTWHWGHEAEHAVDQVLRSGNTEAADLLRAMRSFLGDNDMMAYLAMMAVRLIELHRVLKPGGSLYLHCDPTASHYIKILLDAIFGARNFRNEIVWQRTQSHGRAKRWGPIHDIVFFYSMSESYVWNRVYEMYDQSYLDSHYTQNDAHGRHRLVTLDGPGIRHGSSGLPWRGVDPTTKGRHWELPPDRALPDWFEHPPGYGSMNVQERLDVLDEAGLIYWPPRGKLPQYKRYLSASGGNPIQDIITDIPTVNSQAQERIGYPTQKPVALLERIISASSNPGDTVLDPFCGCGTAIHAAQKLDRRWIGIDITHLSISLIERRLKDAFSNLQFEVHGTPKDIDGARDLAHRDKYQFQWWALSLVDAQPYGGKKKGADSGIDGLIYFRSGSRTTERAIVSVKGGENIGVPMIRDLKGVLDRERAPIGIFLTLNPPTRPMQSEAASAGFYTFEERQYPCIQIITIDQALHGNRPAIPLVDAGATFRRAAREETRKQDRLL